MEIAASFGSAEEDRRAAPIGERWIDRGLPRGKEFWHESGFINDDEIIRTASASVFIITTPEVHNAARLQFHPLLGAVNGSDDWMKRALKLAQGLGKESIGRREPSNALAFDGSIHRNLLAEGRLAPTPADLKDAEARERLIDAQL